MMHRDPNCPGFAYRDGFITKQLFAETSHLERIVVWFLKDLVAVARVGKRRSRGSWIIRIGRDCQQIAVESLITEK